MTKLFIKGIIRAVPKILIKRKTQKFWKGGKKVKNITILLVVSVLVAGGLMAYGLLQRSPVTTEEPKTSEIQTPETKTEPSKPVILSLLELDWKQIELPPPEGFNQIIGFLLEDGGETITIYRAVRAGPNLRGTVYFVWKSVDEGKTWTKEGEVLDTETKISGEFPTNVIEIDWPSDPIYQKEILPPSTNLDVLGLKIGNEKVILRDLRGELLAKDTQIPRLKKPTEDFLNGQEFLREYLSLFSLRRLFLSVDGGESWWQLNFPPGMKSLDAYPETEELTLLAKFVSFEDFDKVELINSKDTLKIFTFSEKEIWQASIDLSSLNKNPSN